MILTLSKLGLYSIMHVTKRRCWSRGSHYTMYKACENGMKVFVYAYRDFKIKIFVSSCSTTTLWNCKSILEGSGATVTLRRLQVVGKYGTHKSKSTNCQMKNKDFIITLALGSVDTADNRRDNLISHHDIISTERWEMKFLGFILSMCEANAFSCCKFYAEGSDRIVHSAFKDRRAYSMLKYCGRLLSSNKTRK
jgi:hypothetical protein